MTARDENEARTILLVESDRNARHAMSEFLSAIGYAVLSVAEESEALATMKERAIDLVIMELLLQGKDGLQTHEAMLKGKQGTKILFVSSYPLALIDKGKDMTSGLHILERPFTPGELVRSIRSMLNA